MSDYQETVLKYLENFQPEEFETLKRENRLKYRMNELVERIYEERDQQFVLLAAAHPEITDTDMLITLAGHLAIEVVLPLPEFVFNIDDLEPLDGEGDPYADLEPLEDFDPDSEVATNM